MICGTEYSYCPNCQSDADKETWMFLFDKKNCKDIYEVLNKYNYNDIDKKVAYDALSKLDTTVVTSECALKQLEEINAVAKKEESSDIYKVKPQNNKYKYTK